MRGTRKTSTSSNAPNAMILSRLSRSCKARSQVLLGQRSPEVGAEGGRTRESEADRNWWRRRQAFKPGLRRNGAGHELPRLQQALGG